MGAHRSFRCAWTNVFFLHLFFQSFYRIIVFQNLCFFFFSMETFCLFYYTKIKKIINKTKKNIHTHTFTCNYYIVFFNIKAWKKKCFFFNTKDIDFQPTFLLNLRGLQKIKQLFCSRLTIGGQNFMIKNFWADKWKPNTNQQQNTTHRDDYEHFKIFWT